VTASKQAFGVDRPVQLGLLEGADRGVGPILPSVIHGLNDEMIRQVAPLYLTGSVLDVTYGRGMWWRKFQPEPFGKHDLALDGVDFRDLPYADRSWDTVCFDPPYVPRHGDADATHVRDQDFRDRFGLAESRSQLEMRQLIADGMAECARVASRWLLVKCCDYSTGRRLHLGHVSVIEDAAASGLRCHDLIVLASGSGPGGGQIKTVKRARRAHSYLLVFEHSGRMPAGAS
jgi:hypothetical protein